MSKKGIFKRIVAGTAGIATLATCIGTGVSLDSSKLTANAVTNTNYAKLLQYSLYFYDANMCGDEVTEKSAFSWRDDCHCDDEVLGGYHDAGDHVKFGTTIGYSMSTLNWSYYEFGDAFDATGQTSHLKEITDYGCEYMRNCTTLSNGSVTNFIYQIGDGSADHNTWCAPEDQDSSSRKTYSTTNGASDIAAYYAAALASNYVNFGNSEDLEYAEALFEFSTKYNTVATDGPDSFYAAWDYYDRQAWAAGWLYLATGDSTYKTFLNTFMNASSQGKSGQAGCQWGVYSTFSWNNVSLGAACLQAEITGSSSDWNKVTTYLSSNGTSSSSYYCESSWGSCRYNTSQQFAALVCDKYGYGSNYDSWAQGQMDYILGNNSADTCFVVGYASNSSKYPHHRAASGYDSNEEFNNAGTGEGTYAHTLTGALVGGPTDSNFTYTDSVQDYTANEVALDYNATLVAAAAGLYYDYKTGSVDSEVEGIGSVSTEETTEATTTATTTTTTTTQKAATTTTTTTKKASTTTTSTSKNATTTTTTTKKVTTTTTTTSPSSSGESVAYTLSSEEGTDGNVYAYVEFSPGSYKTITVTYDVTSSDTESTGAFGTWTGTWDEVSFKETVSNGSVTVTYSVPSNVGSTVKCSVYWPGVDSVSNFVVTGSTDTVSTTAAATTTTTSSNSSSTGSSGGYEVEYNQSVTYSNLPSDDKMIGFDWSDFGIGSDETITAVDINISTKNSSGIGTWQGAFGTSTTDADNGYWAQTDDMEESFSTSKSGTITWDIDSSISSIIQTEYGGQLKFGVWWIDCDTFKIESIVVYTDKNPKTSGSSETTTTTTTTTKTTTTTTTTTKTTTKATTKATTTTAKTTAKTTVKTTTATTTTTTKTYTYTGTASVYGDTNSSGDVSISDVVQLNKFLVGSVTLSNTEMANADCSYDSTIDATDSVTILKYLVQAVDSLPIYN